MGCITLLRNGWAPGVGDEDFYPPDLPEDWRLSYFSNLYHAVLVPEWQWRGANGAQLRAWVEDTPARFRFFLEIDDPGSQSVLERVSLRLGERLGGVLCGKGVPFSMPGPYVPQVFRFNSRLGEDAGLAIKVPAELILDLRGARTLIETLVLRQGKSGCGSPTLLALGACEFGHLERWSSLAELMGIA